MCAVLLSFIAIPALAEEPQKPAPPQSDRALQRARMMDIEYRVQRLRPQRRDEPLRDLNLTDNEVREIQAVAKKYAMDTMLNISPVIAGCPCEEGPLCTDQVYIVSQRPEKAVGMELSHVRNAWVVGTVQKWWFQYAALEAKSSKMEYREYESARQLLFLEFPLCVDKDGNAKK
jgi:hypothetical protein